MKLSTSIILIVLLVCVQTYFLVSFSQYFWLINIISWGLAIIIGSNTKSAR